MAFVTIRIKGAEGYTRTALSKDRMVLGRSSDNDIPIKHTSISREHCAFIHEAGEWFVEDLGSSNGTWVGESKLTDRVALAEKDIIKTGRARMTFHVGDIKDAEAAVDLGSDDDFDLGDDDDDAPSVKIGEVPEAMRCRDCDTWMSKAHRTRGDKMACPRCGHSNVVTA
jgi:predicted component of type VI protein secretion system